MSAILAECIAKKLDGGMTLVDVYETYGITYDVARNAYVRVRGERWVDPRHPKAYKRKVFTADAIEQASAMWAAGASIADIAATFGVTYHAAEMHMSRHRDRYPYRYDMSNRHKRGERGE